LNGPTTGAKANVRGTEGARTRLTVEARFRRPYGAGNSYRRLFPGFRLTSAVADVNLHPGLLSKHPSGMQSWATLQASIPDAIVGYSPSIPPGCSCRRAGLFSRHLFGMLLPPSWAILAASLRDALAAELGYSRGIPPGCSCRRAGARFADFAQSPRLQVPSGLTLCPWVRTCTQRPIIKDGGLRSEPH
jgi:hypothetical protein